MNTDFRVWLKRRGIPGKEHLAICSPWGIDLCVTTSSPESIVKDKNGFRKQSANLEANVPECVKKPKAEGRMNRAQCDPFMTHKETAG